MRFSNHRSFSAFWFFGILTARNPRKVSIILGWWVARVVFWGAQASGERGADGMRNRARRTQNRRNEASRDRGAHSKRDERTQARLLIGLKIRRTNPRPGGLGKIFRIYGEAGSVRRPQITTNEPKVGSVDHETRRTNPSPADRTRLVDSGHGACMEPRTAGARNAARPEMTGDVDPQTPNRKA
jgi:hypothetical protein